MTRPARTDLAAVLETISCSSSVKFFCLGGFLTYAGIWGLYSCCCSTFKFTGACQANEVLEVEATGVATAAWAVYED